MKDKGHECRGDLILLIDLENEPLPRKYYLTTEEAAFLLVNKDNIYAKEFKDIYQDLWQKDQWGDKHPPRIESLRIMFHPDASTERKNHE
jgi:hypothetical protein